MGLVRFQLKAKIRFHGNLPWVGVQKTRRRVRRRRRRANEASFDFVRVNSFVHKCPISAGRLSSEPPWGSPGTVFTSNSVIANPSSAATSTQPTSTGNLQLTTPTTTTFHCHATSASTTPTAECCVTAWNAVFPTAWNAMFPTAWIAVFSLASNWSTWLSWTLSVWVKKKGGRVSFHLITGCPTGSQFISPTHGTYRTYL